MICMVSLELFRIGQCNTFRINDHKTILIKMLCMASDDDVSYESVMNPVLGVRTSSRSTSLVDRIVPDLST